MQEHLLQGQDAELTNATREAQEPSPQTGWVMFLGTVNAILVAWCFGVYPEYIWIVFCIEGPLLFLSRFWNVTQPNDMKIPGYGRQPMFRVLYMLEYCYYVNYMGIVVALIVVMDPSWFTKEVASVLFAAGFGVSATLLVATAVFQNQLVFHDVDQTVSVFIHFFPALVFYTLRWHYGRLSSAWPHIFFRGPFDDLEPFTIWKYAVMLYLSWFVPYLVWMLLGGKELPQSKNLNICCLNGNRETPYDTCFHFSMRETPFGKLTKHFRGYSNKEWEKKGNDHNFNALDVLVYMALHACSNIFGPLFGVLLYVSPFVGGSSIAVVLVVTLWYASSRTYAKMIHMAAELRQMREQTAQMSGNRVGERATFNQRLDDQGLAVPTEL